MKWIRNIRDRRALRKARKIQAARAAGYQYASRRLLAEGANCIDELEAQSYGQDDPFDFGVYDAIREWDPTARIDTRPKYPFLG